MELDAGNIEGYLQRHKAKTLLRFLANSTFGLGGFFDVATPRGVVRQPAGDFGATLYKWGVGEGPYLVLPLLGPSRLAFRRGLCRPMNLGGRPPSRTRISCVGR